MENERKDALEDLLYEVARVVEIGLNDLPGDTKLKVASMRNQGCRLQVKVMESPLELECLLVGADSSSSVWLFKIQDESEWH